MRKILYISGTRADYGLIRNALFLIKKYPGLKIEIAATGMHLMSEFGNTVKEIEKDKFKIHKIKSVFKEDSKKSQVEFIGKFILEFLEKIKKIKPDLIFVQGDRPEMLAGAIAGVYLKIPIVHSHGGEVSFTVDEVVRHAISKLANIHFVSTKKSGQRLIKMGENSWRIFIIGAPGLDDIFKKQLFSSKEIIKKYKLDSSKPFILVVQHPTSKEQAAQQITETMEAIKEIGWQTIIIYPSADPGGREIIKNIKKYEKYSFIQTYKNIPRNDYLSLMKAASVLVGNSSSGIIEAPSFNLPAVNIGERQNNREKSINIINVNYNKKNIKQAILKAVNDKKFIEKVKKEKNPYGNGQAGKKIAQILSEIKIDKKLLEKQITY